MFVPVKPVMRLPESGGICWLCGQVIVPTRDPPGRVCLWGSKICREEAVCMKAGDMWVPEYKRQRL